MPTPSSDPPLDPSTPSSYNFSTCPEDLQSTTSRTMRQIPSPAQDGTSGREVRRSPSPDDASQDTLAPETDRDSNVTELAALLDVEASIEASSRATTMSPRPQSSATALTSPAPSGPDSDSVKNVEVLEFDRPVSRSRAASNRSQASPRRSANSEERDLDYEDDAMSEDDLDLPSMSQEFPCLRTNPTSPSSFLRPGSRFHGTQQSEKQVYNVQVEIKHIDMRESFLCGYLGIQGLTEDHPTLTTYFEGEIIGNKYSFYTQHEEWGANTKVDLSHWSKFSAFRPFQKQARKGPVLVQDAGQRENIFMRWKEHFLVPDHRVRTINGASFEGFYYICFNQVKGEVSGIYFHAKSEKFQQLELKHVPDQGCFSALEFR